MPDACDSISLPNPDLIRDRIERLESEANQLRRLLRLVVKITATPAKPATMPTLMAGQTMTATR